MWPVFRSSFGFAFRKRKQWAVGHLFWICFSDNTQSVVMGYFLNPDKEMAQGTENWDNNRHHPTYSASLICFKRWICAHLFISSSTLPAGNLGSSIVNRKGKQSWSIPRKTASKVGIC
ncbi:hypothetical protein Ddc_04153 [Ditylenchus destructor]|nr:hypothetical protein Ddc_04153 [Ditylenchus destructor]